MTKTDEINLILSKITDPVVSGLSPLKDVLLEMNDNIQLLKGAVTEVNNK